MSELTEKVTPAAQDPFVHGLTEVIGGPRGRHAVPETPARGGKFWTAARIVLALTCLTLVLHWIQKSPCSDGAWTDYKQYTRFCYTDVLALYGAENEKLNEGKIPYLESSVEYPVLTGIFMGVVGLPIHAIGQDNPGMNQYEVFYQVTALALMAFAVASVAMILSIRRRRPWDAALFALSPVMLVTATVNWDFLAIVLAVAGVVLWAKKHPIWAGVLLGLGTAAKLWPGFLFIPILALGVRHFRRRADIEPRVWQLPFGELLRKAKLDQLADARWSLRKANPLVWSLLSVGAGIVTWLALNVPIMMANYQNWYKFIDLNTTRGIDWGTSWYIARYMDSDVFKNVMPEGFFGDVPTINKLYQGAFVLAIVGIVWLTLRAPKTPRLGQLMFLIVAIFLVTNKVWSQQFTLWLLPLIVLARPKWGAFLAWQFGELCYFFAFYGELLGAAGKGVIPEGTFIVASLFRMGTVIALIVLVVRDILRPELDPVRDTYSGDPDRGLFPLRESEDHRVRSVLALDAEPVASRG